MRGTCVCGGVEWSTTAPLRAILECHCHRCRHITGNYMAATAVPTEQLDVSGQTLSWFSPEDDPNVAYAFCSHCGSTLFYRSGVADGTNQLTSIAAGSLDEPSGLHTAEIWYAAHAADHVRLDPSIDSFDTEPPR